MIRFQDIKTGDLILADFEGQRFEGEVTEVNHEDKQVCVQNGDQDAWFEPNDLYAIPLDDNQLLKLGFEKAVNADNSVKYMRGPFRVLIPSAGQFNEFEIWYREDRRHIHQAISVHELQNYYHQMTKVDLSRV
jgi:hypothetical protein